MLQLDVMQGNCLRNLCSPDLRKGDTVDALSENYQVNVGGPQSLPTLFSSPAYWSVFLKWKGSLRTEDDRASRCTWSPLTDPAGLTGSRQTPGTICLHLPSTRAANQAGYHTRVVTHTLDSQPWVLKQVWQVF